MTDPYNGWTNRETWAAHLYMSNDQDWQEYARTLWAEAKAGVLRYIRTPETVEEFTKIALGMYAEKLKDWWESQRDLVVERACARDTTLALLDIGSLWRVNWKEIAIALTEK